MMDRSWVTGNHGNNTRRLECWSGACVGHTGLGIPIPLAPAPRVRVLRCVRARKSQPRVSACRAAGRTLLTCRRRRYSQSTKAQNPIAHAYLQRGSRGKTSSRRCRVELQADDDGVENEDGRRRRTALRGRWAARRRCSRCRGIVGMSGGWGGGRRRWRVGLLPQGEEGRLRLWGRLTLLALLHYSVCWRWP